MEKKKKKKKIHLSKMPKINLRFPVCIVLATILWLYVMTEKNPEIVFSYYEVPINILNEDKLEIRGLKAMNLKNYTATVSLRGLKSDFIAFNEDRIEASIDLSGYGEGEMKVPVVVSLKEPKYDLIVESIEPSVMLVQFDKIISEERDLRIINTGELREGTVLKKIVPEIEKVNITGPRSFVQRVSYAEGVVNLEDMNDNSTFYIPIRPKDKDGNIVQEVSIDPDEVSGNIFIKQRKTLPVALKFTGDLPTGVVIDEIEYSPKEVSVLTDKENLSIDEIPTTPIDLSTIQDSPNFKVELKTPNNISLENPNEKISIQIGYVEELQKTKIIDKEDIVIENIPDNMNIIITDESIIKIILMGEENLIENYIPTLYLTFENKEYEEGNIEMNLDVKNLPEGIRAEIYPKTLRINLEKKVDKVE